MSATLLPHHLVDTLAEFTSRIEQECLIESCIDPTLYADAVAIYNDLEISPSGEPTTPIHDALGWHYTRFGRQVKAAFHAALFLNEDGSCWQAKLSQPRQDGGKIIKYEAPTGAGSKPYLPPVPPVIRQRIASRYGVDVPMEGSFWEWLSKHPEIPIVFTEGAKKSLSLLSLGYVAIALYGVHGGYRATDALKRPLLHPVLIPGLRQFTSNDRPVILAFDQDAEAKTRRKVTAALFKFGWLLTVAGCTVKLALWDGNQGKGCDDLIASAGPDAFHRAIDQAQTLEEHRLWLALENRLTIAPALRVNTADLSKLEGLSIPQSGILAIASAKGTGKTLFIAGLVKGGYSSLLLGHRIALTRNLCARLEIDYRGDLDKVEGRFISGSGYTLRVGGCVDGTLLAINPADFAGCDLVIDETAQVLRHLLTSSTCNKEGKRPVLLSRFAELVKSARRVILADADLDNACIQYIQALRDEPNERPWLLVNDAKVEPWPVTFIEAPDTTPSIARVLADVQAGRKVFVTTDSKAGSKRLERLITQLEQAGLRVLVLNSDTSGGELERQFITAPDANLNYDVVIATPSMATGVSIEAEHFDVVYGIFWGASSTDADMSQALARVRQPVPRVVWCAKHGCNFSHIGRDTSSLQLKKLLADKSSATAQLTAASLGASLGAELRGYDWLNHHINAWAKFEAERNRSMLALRTALKVRLTHEGHTLTIEQLETHAAVRDKLKADREAIAIAEAEAIASADNLTATDARALEQLETLDPDERLALAKWHLADFHCVPPEQVTVDLALADNQGRRRGQLLNLEQFLYPDTATNADIKAIEKQAKWGRGLTPWDVPHAVLKREIRERLGFTRFLEEGQQWTSDSLAEFKDQALALAPQIKAALNIHVHQNMSAAQILGQLLEQLGLKTCSQQYREGGKHKRRYWLDAAVAGDAFAVLQRRAARNQAHAGDTAAVTPPPVSSYEEGGCYTQEPPAIGDLSSSQSPTLSLDDLAEVRQMIEDARCIGEQALQELQRVFPPEVWESAIAA
ncbi:MAG TPA: plasmid replication protein, CyRepA1 family [Leptolyngbyaceae cyanobacterium]